MGPDLSPQLRAQENKKISLSPNLSGRGKVKIKNKMLREFPSGPVVRTRCSHCCGPGFDPWFKKKKKKRLCSFAFMFKNTENSH